MYTYMITISRYTQKIISTEFEYLISLDRIVAISYIFEFWPGYGILFLVLIGLHLTVILILIVKRADLGKMPLSKIL